MFKNGAKELYNENMHPHATHNNQKNYTVIRL